MQQNNTLLLLGNIVSGLGNVGGSDYTQQENTTPSKPKSYSAASPATVSGLSASIVAASSRNEIKKEPIKPNSKVQSFDGVVDRFSDLDFKVFGLFPSLEEMHYANIKRITRNVGVICSDDDRESIISRATGGDEAALYLPLFKAAGFSFMCESVMNSITCFFPTYNKALYNTSSRFVETRSMNGGAPCNDGISMGLDGFFGNNERNKAFAFMKDFVDPKKNPDIIDGGMITSADLSILIGMEISEVTCTAINTRDKSKQELLDRMRIGIRFPGLHGLNGTRAASESTGQYAALVSSGNGDPKIIQSIDELDSNFTDLIFGINHTPTAYTKEGTVINKPASDDSMKADFYGSSNPNYFFLRFYRLGFFMTFMYNLCDWLNAYKYAKPNDYLKNCGLDEKQWDLIMKFNEMSGDTRFFNQSMPAVDNYIGKLLYLLSPKNMDNRSEIPIPPLGGQHAWKISSTQGTDFTLSVPYDFFKFCLDQYNMKASKTSAVRKDAVTVTTHLEGECVNRVKDDQLPIVSFVVDTKSIDAVVFYVHSKYDIKKKK